MSQPYAARIVSVEDKASDVRLIELDLGPDAPPFDPGGHLDFHLPSDIGVLTRSYSMVDVSERGHIRIAVKRAPQSRGGSLRMWALAPGDVIEVRSAPNTLPATFAGDSYTLVAGGIGITPLIGITRRLIRAGKDVRLVYAVRDADDAPFVDELRAELGDRLVIHEDGRSGLLDVAGLVTRLDPGAFLYMCGPAPMMDAIGREWRSGGRPVNRLRFETFGNSGQFPSVDFVVEIVETGDVVPVVANQTLLEALVSAGQPVMYDCRKGECGLCKVGVVSFDGQIDHRDVFFSEDEKRTDGAMCCCVSRIYGARARISIDGILHGRAAHGAAARSGEGA